MSKILLLQAVVAFSSVAVSNCFIWSSTKRSPGLLMSAGQNESKQTFFASLEQSLRSLGSTYKTNRVVDDFNEGTFKAVPLFGRLRDVTTQPTTIDAMTFNSFPDLPLGPLLLLNGEDFVYKGQSAPHAAASPNLYAVQTPFRISKPELKLAQKSGDGSWIPTSGVCTVIGTFEPSEDGKQLTISLERVELTLRDESNNAHKFDPRQFTAPFIGSHEVLLMTPEFTAVKGNFGSIFLFFPVNK
mmetsp:Transcript_18094/g.20861  ORF Transcript_18094/g.20861 Transcript_18094/m.20861 type:complete len:243 (+) Transcript_18094:116-844(+)|eukprot:CAMPEP_0194146364 /NCGR_PEP_ID=MMETSP0152-20130528/20546_1 /TAXON_ID=1049557 /ORGANISM="Thalassiothrix antarctica, Strain L6-D1" /LENGTH=242 /DNA_ID=CAMNT_0038846863 /DNA_START=39 /DNA_END=767 /DNA_ORIENTATION=-